MHERIKLVSDTEVNIQRNIDHEAVSRYEICAGELIFNSPRCCVWDALGNEAEILVRQCWKDTGSFAALADTSAVPFIGKRMRYEWKRASMGPLIEPVTVIAVSSESCGIWHILNSAGQHVITNDLRPFTDPTPPPKKWRAYTLKEAADHCGREFESKENRTYPARYQTTKRVDSLNSNVVFDYDCKHGICYQSFCNDYVWSDTGEPCGMEVTE